MKAAELTAFVDGEISKIEDINKHRKGHGFADSSTVIFRLLNSRKQRELLRRALGGSPELLHQWDVEPHFRANIIRGEPIPSVRFFPNKEIPSCVLSKDAPTKPYVHTIRRSWDSLHSTVHIGQRKLLIGEVLFMTHYGSKSKTVVYIGAAGGSHIPALCELFPEHKFLLYDPAPFSRPLLDYMHKNPSRISVYNELFPPSDKSGQALEIWRSGPKTVFF